MGDKTTIQWTDATWGVQRGCTRLSSGCVNCYAEKIAARFSGPGLPYEGTINKHGRWNGEIRVAMERMEDPLRWKRPRRIFISSMSDVFHPSVTPETHAQIFDVMKRAKQHTFQVLTKRPENIAARLPADWGDGYPNVWLGVSVENQAATARMDHLARVPARVRFLSVEPLLGKVDLGFMGTAPADWHLANPTAYKMVWEYWNWVICGGESGTVTSSRICRAEWIRSIVDQCTEVNIPCHVKQLGSQYLDSENGIAGARLPLRVDVGAMLEGRDTTVRRLKDGHGGDRSEWGPGPWPQEFPAAPSAGAA